MKRGICIILAVMVCSTVYAEYTKISDTKVRITKEVSEDVDTSELLKEKERLVRYRDFTLSKYSQKIAEIDKQLQNIVNNAPIAIDGYKSEVNWEKVSELSKVEVNWSDIQSLQSEHYITRDNVYVTGCTPEVEADYTRSLMLQERAWNEYVRGRKAQEDIQTKKVRRGMNDYIIT